MELAHAAGIEPALSDPETAHLVIEGNSVRSSRLVSGLHVTAREADGAVKVNVRLDEGTVIKNQVHMCFGVLHEKAEQYIKLDILLGKGSSISLLAHCVFPNAQDVIHKMDADIELAEGASYSYIEKHIHSEGFVKVLPKAKVKLGKASRFYTEFELLKGRVGEIEIDYETICGEDSIMEMTAKISGKKEDKIIIRETGHLQGDRARGVLTSRIAVTGDAIAKVFNTLTADGGHCTGHVDCKEIVKDQAKAHAIPIVEVNNPTSHVTHEAAIGSVDSKQLETLMSRGLSEDEATDLIIKGLLS